MWRNSRKGSLLDAVKVNLMKVCAHPFVLVAGLVFSAAMFSHAQAVSNYDTCVKRASSSQAKEDCEVLEQLRVAGATQSASAQLADEKRQFDEMLASYVQVLSPSVSIQTGGSYRGVDFACNAIPQANLNGVTLASEVQTTATNVSGRKLVVRYHVVVTSNQQRVEEFTQGFGVGAFTPGRVERHSLSPFEKASVQDEFPKTCEFTQIQVCPADPPAGFPTGQYFRPFIDGGAECKAIGNITIPLGLPVAVSAPTCAAIVVQQAYNTTQGTHYFYGWASGQPTVDAAVAEARRQAIAKRGGEPLGSESAGADPESDRIVASDCVHKHGALSVQQKGSDFSADTYWYVNGVSFSDSEGDAKSDSLQSCLARNKQTRIDCNVIASW